MAAKLLNIDSQLKLNNSLPLFLLPFKLWLCLLAAATRDVKLGCTECHLTAAAQKRHFR